MLCRIVEDLMIPLLERERRNNGITAILNSLLV